MLVASLTFGGAGTICGAGNVAPGWVVRIYDEYRHGNMQAAVKLQDELYRLVTVLRTGVFPLAIKAALEMQGVCEGWSAPPARKLDDAAQIRLREFLSTARLLPD
jgi:4-hydroxy-tetrahydrodipicolinate synthase